MVDRETPIHEASNAILSSKSVLNCSPLMSVLVLLPNDIGYNSFWSNDMLLNFMLSEMTVTIMTIKEVINGVHP